MSSAVEAYFFAGPTLYGLCSDTVRDISGIHWLPPVKRGDVERLVSAEPPQRMVIVDGQLEHCLSVAHREILQALETGWVVWGLSSMGAIRAYELRDFGVRGFGEVYGRFFLEDDFRDDEVALIHEQEPPYRSFSEPLIHIRVALEDLVARDVLKLTSANRIVEHLASLWFGERTLERLQALVVPEVSPFHAASITEWVSNFSKYRIKSHDLAKFMRSFPPESAAPA